MTVPLDQAKFPYRRSIPEPVITSEIFTQHLIGRDQHDLNAFFHAERTQCFDRSAAHTAVVPLFRYAAVSSVDKIHSPTVQIDAVYKIFVSLRRLAKMFFRRIIRITIEPSRPDCRQHID